MVNTKDQVPASAPHAGLALLLSLAMAVKLIEAAQDRWRAVNAPHLVARVRAGATFTNGKLIERPGEKDQPEAA